MSLAIGPVTVNGSLINVALVGGNCSILGFNNKGEDVFWTVSGDNVSALAFAYIEHDPPEILAGSEDYAIRVFNNEELISEINEAAKVTNFA